MDCDDNVRRPPNNELNQVIYNCEDNEELTNVPYTVHHLEDIF